MFGLNPGIAAVSSHGANLACLRLVLTVAKVRDMFLIYLLDNACFLARMVSGLFCSSCVRHGGLTWLLKTVAS